MVAKRKAPVTQTIPIDKVVVPENRKRSVRGGIEDLARSIRELGLFHPIVVTSDRVLVAGLHRLRACEALGWEEIPAVVVTLSELDAELAEIDENLCRAELDAQERAEQTARRKAIYEAKHPETRRGVAGAKASNAAQGKGDATADSAVAFTTETARQSGKSERAVRQDVQIAEGIAPEVFESIRGTRLAKQKTNLLQLAQLGDPALQAKVADLLIRGAARSIAQARKQLAKVEPEAEGVRDEAGHVITDPALAQVFTRLRPLVRRVVRQTRAGLRDLEELRRQGPVAVEIRMRSGRSADELHRAEDDLLKALDALSLMDPYSVCPLCQGADPKCGMCSGGGWVNKWSLRQHLQTVHGGRLPKGALRGE